MQPRGDAADNGALKVVLTRQEEEDEEEDGTDE